MRILQPECLSYPRLPRAVACAAFLWLSACAGTPPPNRPVSVPGPGAERVLAAVRERAAGYFRVGKGSVDPYPLLTEAGGNGLYRVFNTDIKGSFAGFIADGGRVLAPGDDGYDFPAVARAVDLSSRMPDVAVQAAEAFVLVSSERFVWGAVERGDPRPGYGEKGPVALRRGRGWYLEFRTFHATSGRRKAFRLEIGDDGSVRFFAVKLLDE